MTTNTMKFLEELTGGPLTLGNAIRAIRLADEIKQGAFAKKLRVSQSYLSDLENNRKEVSAQQAAKFAGILRQSKSQFIRLALQDSLTRQGLKKYKVDIDEAA
ncbi:MAG: transcriptional regulator [Legionellaceae bacterium]|nr:transcriptional regulator [Legionellaceae bacterium]